MKIIVCLKQVPKNDSILRIDFDEPDSLSAAQHLLVLLFESAFADQLTARRPEERASRHGEGPAFWD